jgi:hypothetical protein
LPDEAGTGSAAQRCANRLVGEPGDVLAGGDEELGGVVGADAEPDQSPGRSAPNQAGELLVEAGDLGVEAFDPASGAAQRRLGGVGGLVELGCVRSEAGADPGPGGERFADGKLLADRRGGGNDQVAELAEGGSTGLERRSAHRRLLVPIPRSGTPRAHRPLAGGPQSR